MPRLSVDADLTYVGQVTKEGLEAERPEMERALTELGTRLGYSVSTSGGKPRRRMESHESAEEARGTRGRLSGVVTVTSSLSTRTSA